MKNFLQVLLWQVQNLVTSLKIYFLVHHFINLSSKSVRGSICWYYFRNNHLKVKYVLFWSFCVQGRNDCHKQCKWDINKSDTKGWFCLFKPMYDLIFKFSIFWLCSLVEYGITLFLNFSNKFIHCWHGPQKILESCDIVWLIIENCTSKDCKCDTDKQLHKK